MMVLIGTYLGESDREFTWVVKDTGEVKSGTEKNLHILDGLYTRIVTRQKDFDNSRLPQVGQEIALEVWGKGIGRQVAYMGVRVLDVKAEDFSKPAPVRAAG